MTELMEYMVELTEILIDTTETKDKAVLERLYTIRGNLTQMIQEQDINPTDGFKESTKEQV